MSTSTRPNRDAYVSLTEALSRRLEQLRDQMHSLRLIAHDLRQEHTCVDRSRGNLWIDLKRECPRCRGEGALAHYEQMHRHDA